MNGFKKWDCWWMVSKSGTIDERFHQWDYCWMVSKSGTADEWIQKVGLLMNGFKKRDYCWMVSKCGTADEWFQKVGLLMNGFKKWDCWWMVSKSGTADDCFEEEKWLQTKQGGGMGGTCSRDCHQSYSAWGKLIIRKRWEAGCGYPRFGTNSFPSCFVFQPWYNLLWLSGLKTPTYWLWRKPVKKGW